MDDLNNWISTKEAGKRAGVTSHRIYELYRFGDVRGRKFSPRNLLVYWPDVLAYFQSDRPRPENRMKDQEGPSDENSEESTGSA